MENPNSEQVEILDKIVGRKIWDIEIEEQSPVSSIRIFFSENEDDYLEISAEYIIMAYIAPKIKQLH